MIKRREFLAKAGTLTAAVGTGSLISAPAVHARPKKFRFKMVTTWPPKFPVLQTGAEEFAKKVKIMSGGRLSIHVFAGGELVPPLGVFDAVSSGSVEMGHGAAYYWAGKVPEAQFFTSAPFGFTAQQLNAWMYYGGGLDLWREVYAPFNLVPLPACNTGVQMGGWFNKKIDSLADLKGLKMRIPGLGGKVMSKAGVNVVLLPGGELYTALERGVIDALEWVGPYHDLKIGFYRAAKYYYYPGWHEPGSCLELVINKKAWEKLPKDLQQIVKSASAEANLMTLAELDAKNGSALNELVSKYKVNILKYPDDVLKKLHELSTETYEELSAGNPKIAKVYANFKKFAAQIEPWTAMSTAAFIDAKKL
ncbi:TRAP transporter solute receptor, unknown substrate 6 [hydrothermal vent metagenome]|uniref:TRAP-type C4-dicarboxylate transport system, periplasmic component n=1 Tax=hydrothermal vent metagenome TaxID=652676 RepID=A0A3B1C6M5_9ZZZZ